MNRAAGIVAATLALPSPAPAQTDPLREPVDSVAVQAGGRYAAGGLHRFLLGDNYRELWKSSVRVQILDLRTFAGGLRPVKAGGGLQTKSLRLITPDGVEYVFRCVDKDKVNVAPRFKSTVVEWTARDQVSATLPAGALVAAPLLAAGGVLHTTPVLRVMPDDTLLGVFRGDFANRLGLLEEFPAKRKHHPGFARADEIIDSDALLRLLNADPHQRIDERAFLTARLMDMLLNNWDRHPGQWKWARFDGRPGWVPISRDQDWAFGSVQGVLLGLARPVAPKLLLFNSDYVIPGLTWNSLGLDRRLLAGLGKATWDSVSGDLVRGVSDSVIDAAVKMLPPEYATTAPKLAAILKARRDGLPQAADRFYHLLATVVDIHATDAADRATITRVDNRSVDVRLASADGSPYFTRRFDADETREIRVYLHGGDDSAVVTGHVEQSIPIRVIGGDGANRLTDSSTVGGSRQAHLVENGRVTGVDYGPDSLFDRRPWTTEGRLAIPPMRDYGDTILPRIGLNNSHDLGIIPRASVSWSSFGFRERPYASTVGLHGEYSFGVDGFRIWLGADKRWEDSRWHFAVLARMSQLEVLNYHGLGNESPDFDAQVRQRQWLLQPALALTLGRKSELAVGPLVEYSTTDSVPNSLVSIAQPYGYGNFAQAGARLSLHYDSRDQPGETRRGALVDLVGSVFPALWDVTSTFSSIYANTTFFVTIPAPLHPIIVFHVGGAKVFGQFPFHESAFLGGSTTLPTLDAQRYAGDASLFGSTELRVPLLRFPLLVPMDLGIFGLLDAGRVYVNGDSPGGWHTAAGVGFWLGILDPTTSLRICRRVDGQGRC